MNKKDNKKSIAVLLIELKYSWTFKKYCDDTKNIDLDQLFLSLY